VDADGDLRVSQEKSATKESLWDIVFSTLLFPKIKLLTGVILNLVEEYLHHVIDHVTKKTFKKTLPTTPLRQTCLDKVLHKVNQEAFISFYERDVDAKFCHERYSNCGLDEGA
jgi:hypothetical protein